MYQMWTIYSRVSGDQDYRQVRITFFLKKAHDDATERLEQIMQSRSCCKYRGRIDIDFRSREKDHGYISYDEGITVTSISLPSCLFKTRLRGRLG